MIVSISNFFSSSSCFPTSASGPLLYWCFSSDSQHHLQPAESSSERSSSENSLSSMLFQLLHYYSGSYLTFFFPHKEMGRGRKEIWCICLSTELKYHLAQTQHIQFLCCTTHCSFLTEVAVKVFASKLSNHMTFSCNIIYKNVNCILPAHQNFEANKPSLSSVL